MPSRHLVLNLLPLPGAALVALGVQGFWHQGVIPTWSSIGYALAIWAGLGFLSAGCAILFEQPGIYCKRRCGTLPLACWLHLGSWLACYRTSWHIKQCCCLKLEDRLFDRVAPRLLIGRLTWELPEFDGEPQVDMVVDVTCEWSAPPALRGVRRYVSFPVVDTTRPPIEHTLHVARQVVEHLEDPSAGSVYIHCANGYGRSAVVLAAVLLATGICSGPEEAMDRLLLARPVVSFRHHKEKRKKSLCESMTHAELLGAIDEELRRGRSSESDTSCCDSSDQAEELSERGLLSGAC